MKNPVQKINELISYVPARDIPYANKFLETRDFESLRDLIKSDITIIRRKKDDSNAEQLEMLIQLKAEIDNYLLLLGTDDGDQKDFWG